MTATRPTFGQWAIGTFDGQRLFLRYGTSKLGSDWEIVTGDLFGHLPLDMVTDVELIEDPA